MAQEDGGVSVKVKNAKDALASARAKFPQPKAVPSATPRPAVPVMKPASGIGEPEKGIGNELKSKSDNVDQYIKSLPKMHKGGEVMEDGPVVLKAGEHVLTEAEAKKARKHALMAVGMKSLAKEPAKKKPAVAENDEFQSEPSKKAVSDIKVRPEKNQSAKIKIA